MSADGLWQGVAAQQRTSLNLKLEINDVGKFLERIGYPGSMQRGSAKLLGKLAWAGNPQNIDYPTLAGELSLIAEKGQFLKIEPGIGKLLGILSLQALPRRITLDFRDIFSDGFAFDTITGTAAVAKGVLRTRTSSCSDLSAQVAMSGNIDLAQETQALRVRVVPSVGDSLSVAGLVLSRQSDHGGRDISGAAPAQGSAGPGLRLRVCGERHLGRSQGGEAGRATPAGSTRAPTPDSLGEIK